ncbi:hypothetical protein HG561_00755 [Helicobacter pylori]|nr:hypothetical protein [Helicobacter pylori]QQW91707.1 hypothetical protein HG561_00755 [Helicobacter pylori]
MHWRSDSVRSIRDTERETLPQHQQAQSSLAFGRFANENRQKVLLL